MNNDPRLNNILRWGIENSEASRNDPNAPQNGSTNLDAETLQALLGGPSEADLMKEAMATIKNEEANLDAKVTAFEDFEMLIQSIDNANNMEPLQLWTPLVEELDSPEEDLRFHAAWCCGTAVENNVKAQERLLIIGAIPALIKLATDDSSQAVRKKAVRALSCAVRNYQPGLDAAADNVPAEFKPKEKLDAADMESVDILIQKLRDNAARS